MENKTNVVFDGKSKLTGKYHIDILSSFYGTQFHISGRGLNKKEATKDLVTRLLLYLQKKIENPTNSECIYALKNSNKNNQYGKTNPA
jgi:hypothetical protein